MADSPDPAVTVKGDPRPGSDEFGSARTEAGSADPPTPSAKSTALSPGTSVGRYLIAGRLGAGGMGVVYRAFDPDLGRQVALKLLRPGRQRGSEGSARILREAQAMAKLSHPNICTVHDVGDYRGQIYIAMEYVSGQTVKQWLKRRPRWDKVLDVFLQAGDGLAAAHARDLIHRDFKPENVMIDDAKRVRVMDFGLARSTRTDDSKVTVDDSGGDAPDGSALTPELREAAQAQLTRTGSVAGTPAYMAPEQFAGKPTNARTDVFSFCVSLWEGLFTRRPFSAKSLPALMVQVTRGKRTAAPAGSGVPRRIIRVLERGLQPDPTDRWPSMHALLVALRGGRYRKLRQGIGFAAVGATLVLTVYGGRFLVEQRALAGCQADAEAIETIWNEAVAARIRQSITDANGSPADDAARQTVAWLDDYAKNWSDVRQQACRRTEVDGERTATQYAASLACLDDRRVAFETTTELLSAELRRDEAWESVQLAAGLPSVSICAQPTGLDHFAEAPQGHSANGVTDVRRQLASAAASSRAGRFDDALAEARQALSAAQALDLPGLTARSRAQVGELLAEAEDFTGARRELSEAYFTASSHGTLELAARSAIKLAHVLGHDRKAFDEARHWARLAEVALDRSESTSDLTLADWHAVRGVIYRGLGRADDALVEYNEVRELRARSLGAEHPDVAASLNNIALALNDLGRGEDAERTYREVLELEIAALGKDHPSVAITRSNYGVVLTDMGRFDDARLELRAAVDSLTRTRGADHIDVALARDNLALALNDAGDLRAAEAEHRTALEVRERKLGPRHLHVGLSHANLAGLYYAQNRMAEAAVEAAAALDIIRSALGPSHPEVAAALNTVATVEQGQGKYESAVRHYREAIAIRNVALPPEHPLQSGIRVNLAMALGGLGRLEQAEAMYREALGLAIEARGQTHADVGGIHRKLGAHLTDMGKHAEAQAQLRKAVTIVTNALGPRHPSVARAHSALGDSLLEQGRPDEAVAEFRAALAAMEEQRGDNPNLVALLHNELGRALRRAGRLQEAESALRTAIEIKTASHGEASPGVAINQINLAGVMRDAGQTDAAEVEYRAAIAKLEAKVDPHDGRLASGLFNLARLLKAERRNREALVLFERAWEIRSASKASPSKRARAAWALAQALPSSQRARARELAAKARALFDEVDDHASVAEIDAAVARWSR